jgi:hypothetical protein
VLQERARPRPRTLAARAAQIVAATKLPAKSWVKGIQAALAAS